MATILQGCVPAGPRGNLRETGRGIVNKAAPLAEVDPTAHMTETCLRNPADRYIPKMDCIEKLQDSLEQDAQHQQEKYRGESPSGAAARFHVDLPRGPQHMKFCERPPEGGWPARRGSVRSILSGSAMPPVEEQPDSKQLTHTDLEELLKSPEPSERVSDRGGDDFLDGVPTSSHRFNMQTLRGWFKDIDAKHQGSIKQRELIVALRQHRALQALFCSVQGLEYSERRVAGVESQVQARRDEITRIKRILDEIDSDGSGSMEWHEFVEFFRRTGLLLEYQTRRSLNRASNVEEGPILQKAETWDAYRRATMVRNHTSLLSDLERHRATLATQALGQLA